MIYRHLPTEIKIGEKVYPINQKGDYGMILDVLEVLGDTELNEHEKAYVALSIFYDFNIPDSANEINIAVKEMVRFINCGEDAAENTGAERPLMNWIADFPLLVAPINRVLGYDIRSSDCVHWWTVVSAYMEIGECMFQTFVSIRDKKRKGKKLEKWEKEVYQENRKKIDAVNGLSCSEKQQTQNYLDEDW